MSAFNCSKYMLCSTQQTNLCLWNAVSYHVRYNSCFNEISEVCFYCLRTILSINPNWKEWARTCYYYLFLLYYLQFSATYLVLAPIVHTNRQLFALLFCKRQIICRKKSIRMLGPVFQLLFQNFTLWVIHYKIIN